MTLYTCFILTNNIITNINVSGADMKNSDQLKRFKKVKDIDYVEDYSIYGYLPIICLIINFVFGITLLGFGINDWMRCRDTPEFYAGISPILITFLLIFTMVSGAGLYFEQKFLSMVVALLTFVLLCMLVILEILGMICTGRDYYNSKEGICFELKTVTNWCVLVHKTYTTTEGSVTESFRGTDPMRKATLALSAIILCSNTTFLIVLAVAWKIGKPVYLVRKRHRGSIIVGSAISVALAHRNKFRNLVMINAQESEEEWYQYRKIIELKRRKHKRKDLSSFTAPTRTEKSVTTKDTSITVQDTESSTTRSIAVSTRELSPLPVKSLQKKQSNRSRPKF